MAQIEPNSTSFDDINENLNEEKKKEENPMQIQDMMMKGQVSKHRGVSFRVKKGDNAALGTKTQHANYFDDDQMPARANSIKDGKLEMGAQESLFQSMHVQSVEKHKP